MSVTPASMSANACCRLRARAKMRMLRELLAHQYRSADGGLDVVDGEHQKPRALRARSPQQVKPRGVAVEDLVAEAAHEVDVRLAAVEGGEGDALDAQHAAPRSDRNGRSRR